MSDRPRDIAEEAEALQTELKLLASERNGLLEKFSHLSELEQTLSVQLKTDSLASEGHLHSFYQQKKGIEQELLDLEEKLHQKQERINLLDQRASEYLIQVSSESNSVYNEDEETEEEEETNEEQRNLIEKLLLEDMIENEGLPVDSTSGSETSGTDTEHSINGKSTTETVSENERTDIKPKAAAQEISDVSKSKDNTSLTGLEEVNKDINHQATTKGSFPSGLEDQLQSTRKELEMLKRLMLTMSHHIDLKEGELSNSLSESYVRGSKYSLSEPNYRDSSRHSSLLSSSEEELCNIEAPTFSKGLISTDLSFDSVSPSYRGSVKNTLPHHSSTTSISDHVAMLEQNLGSSTRALEESKLQIQCLQGEKKRKEKECADLQDKVKVLDTKMSDLQKTFDSLISTVMSEKDDYLKELKCKEDSINSLQEKLKEAVSNVNMSDVSTDKIEEASAALRTEVKTLQSQILLLKENHDAEKEELVSKHESRCSNIEKELELMKEEKANSEKENINYQKELVNLKNELSSLTDSQQSNQQERSASESQCAANQSTEVDRPASNDNKKESFSASDDSKTESFPASDDNKKESLAMVEILKQQIQEQQQQIEELSGKNVALTAEIYSKDEEYMEELTAREGTIQELRITLTNNQKQSRQNFQMAQDDIAVLQMRLQKEQDESKTTKAVLEEKFNKLEIELQEKQQEFDFVKNKLIETQVGFEEAISCNERDKEQLSDPNESKNKDAQLETTEDAFKNKSGGHFQESTTYSLNTKEQVEGKKSDLESRKEEKTETAELDADLQSGEQSYKPGDVRQDSAITTESTSKTTDSKGGFERRTLSDELSEEEKLEAKESQLESATNIEREFRCRNTEKDIVEVEDNLEMQEKESKEKFTEDENYDQSGRVQYYTNETALEQTMSEASAEIGAKLPENFGETKSDQMDTSSSRDEGGLQIDQTEEQNSVQNNEAQESHKLSAGEKLGTQTESSGNEAEDNYKKSIDYSQPNKPEENFAQEGKKVREGGDTSAVTKLEVEVELSVRSSKEEEDRKSTQGAISKNVKMLKSVEDEEPTYDNKRNELCEKNKEEIDKIRNVEVISRALEKGEFEDIQDQAKEVEEDIHKKDFFISVIESILSKTECDFSKIPPIEEKVKLGAELQTIRKLHYFIDELTDRLNKTEKEKETLSKIVEGIKNCKKYDSNLASDDPQVEIKEISTESTCLLGDAFDTITGEGKAAQPDGQTESINATALSEEYAGESQQDCNSLDSTQKSGKLGMSVEDHETLQSVEKSEPTSSNSEHFEPKVEENYSKQVDSSSLEDSDEYEEKKSWTNSLETRLAHVESILECELSGRQSSSFIDRVEQIVQQIQTKIDQACIGTPESSTHSAVKNTVHKESEVNEDDKINREIKNKSIKNSTKLAKKIPKSKRDKSEPTRCLNCGSHLGKVDDGPLLLTEGKGDRANSSEETSEEEETPCHTSVIKPKDYVEQNKQKIASNAGVVQEDKALSTYEATTEPNKLTKDSSQERVQLEHAASLESIESLSLKLKKVKAQNKKLVAEKKQQTKDFEAEQEKTLEMQNQMVNDLESLILNLESERDQLQKELMRIKAQSLLEPIKEEDAECNANLQKPSTERSSLSDHEAVQNIGNEMQPDSTTETPLTETVKALRNELKELEEYSAKQLEEERARHCEEIKMLRKEIREEIDILEQQKEDVAEDLSKDLAKISSEWAQRLEKKEKELQLSTSEVEAKFGQVIVSKNNEFEKIFDERKKELDAALGKATYLENELHEKCRINDELEKNLSEMVMVRSNLEETITSLKLSSKWAKPAEVVPQCPPETSDTNPPAPPTRGKRKERFFQSMYEQNIAREELLKRSSSTSSIDSKTSSSTPRGAGAMSPDFYATRHGGSSSPHSFSPQLSRRKRVPSPVPLPPVRARSPSWPYPTPFE